MAEEETPRSGDSLVNDEMNEQLQQMNELFSRFKDNPEVETIHTTRLLEVLQAFGKNPSQTDCNKRIHTLQQEDEKFELTLEDFLEVFDEPWTSINNDRTILRIAFERFDSEKQGFIDIEKFREVMHTLGEPLSNDEVDDLIQLGLNDEQKKLDINHLLDELLGKDE